MTGQEIVRAEKKWQREDGARLLKTEGFCEAKNAQYLENRIKEAFRAGIKTAEDAILERLRISK